MKLRVLLLMDPFIKVPPSYYGGIERVVADLARGLFHRGHDVTVWAAPGSQTPGVLEPFGREGEWTRWSNVRNIAAISARLWRQPKRFDVVHNYGRLAYLTSILRWNLPKIQTYMRTVNGNNIRSARRLGARRLHYTAVSAAIRDTGSSAGGEWSVIHNCASPNDYAFKADIDPHGAPLCFVGRLERCKGVHNAIAVARVLNRPLRIAGNISTLAHEKEYFHREIEPLIDGRLITYLGPLNNEEKNELLGSSAAMLMPIEWEEPFPVVLPESLMCGTPVIAFSRGGMPEGVEHGRTGFLCSDVAGMVSAVRRLGEIDRAQCRTQAERRFSDSVIVDEYERLYRRVLHG